VTDPTAERTKVSVHVLVNRKKVELETNVVTGAQLLQAAGFEGQQWDLLELQGEGDPTGGEVILADHELQLKNGDRFRVIPGNRTFGA
jgi:uncharacterized protein YabE (DUF348 family)